MEFRSFNLIWTITIWLFPFASIERRAFYLWVIKTQWVIQVCEGIIIFNKSFLCVIYEQKKFKKFYEIISSSILFNWIPVDFMLLFLLLVGWFSFCGTIMCVQLLNENVVISLCAKHDFLSENQPRKRFQSRVPNNNKKYVKTTRCLSLQSRFHIRPTKLEKLLAIQKKNISSAVRLKSNSQVKKMVNWFLFVVVPLAVLMNGRWWSGPRWAA